MIILSARFIIANITACASASKIYPPSAWATSAMIASRFSHKVFDVYQRLVFMQLFSFPIIRDRLIVGKEKSCMNTKRWYTSKTLWLNLLAIVALVAQAEFGYILDVEAQAVILAGINLLLRALTKKGLS